MFQRPLPKKISLVRLLSGTGIAIILFSSVIFINGLQMLSMLMLPFSRKAVRRFNSACAGFWWGLCVFFSKYPYGVRMIYSGDDVPPRENAILICNHQSMTDILALFFLGIDKRRLGNMKWFVKDALKYFPGAGWGMWFLDFIFLKRNWETDVAYIERSFGKFKEFDIPIWLVSFLEGTRITPAKWEKSREFARSRGFEAPQNVLIPRTKGFVASIRGLRTHLDAVYDITLAYPVGVPTLWQYTKGEMPRIHFDVRRFPMATMPESPEALAAWVQERYREKDRRLQHFADHGAFPPS